LALDWVRQMNMDVVEERAIGLDAAEKRIDRFLEQQGLVCQLESHGGAYGVCFARLYDSEVQISTGAGKGDLVSARVGAKYEAVEHWLTEYDAHVQSKLLPVNRVLAYGGRGDVPLSLLRAQSDTRLLCRSFIDILDGATFFSPLMLFVPGYDKAVVSGDSCDYRGLRRYASNSGTAIGANSDEAMLHALNECVERDALSQFLLRYFYYERDDPLRRVDPACLGAREYSLYEYLESTFSTEVVLLEISTEFCVTTCLAFFKGRYDGPHIYGVGASINPWHAAYRALAELLQLHHVHELGLVRSDSIKAMSALERYPALHRALMFDIRTLTSIPTREIKLECIDAGGLARQVDCIARSLATHGFKAGACMLRDGDVALVCVAVQGFERFFIVGSGNVVLPGYRGQRLKGLAE